MTARRIVVVGLAFLSTMASAALAARPAVAAAPWRVTAQLALGTEDVAVSCALGTTTCWAIESGHLLSSADAGTTWIDRTDTLPTDVVALTDLDCPTARRCFVETRQAGGAGGMLRIDDGVVSAQAAPGDGALVVALSCVGTKRCFATEGKTVWATSDAAASWHAHALPAFIYSNPDIDCVTGTSSCWVVGDNGETPAIERTVNGGKTWTPQTAPSPTDGLYAVTCPTTTTCYGAGANFADDAVIIRTVNAGDTWTFAGVPGNDYAYRSVSCVDATTCVAVGNSPADTPFVSRTTDGLHWTALTVPATVTLQPYQVSCASASQCALVGPTVGDVTVDSGATWTQQDLPAAIEAPGSLSCPTRTYCVGVGSDGAGRPQAITSNDSGKSWVSHTMPVGFGLYPALDCPSASDCYAVASSNDPNNGRLRSQAAYSHDGGVTWQLGRIKNNNGALRQITCASTTSCIAGGFNNRSATALVRTVDSGAHWSPVTPPSGFYLDGIACSSPTSCIVVTNDPEDAPTAWRTTDLGDTYAPHAMPDTDIYSADCFGSLCVGVGSDGGNGAISTSQDAGVTWTRSTVPAAAQLLFDVSCGSATQCAASSYNFTQGGGPVVAGTRDAGQTWRTHRVPARHEAPIAISCHGGTCYASDVSPDGNPIILTGPA